MTNQRPRCNCCGEFLGPEHVGIKERIAALERVAEGLERTTMRLAKLVGVPEVELKKLERRF